MADDTQLTIIGNLTEDPTLRYTPSGAPVANITIASTPRYFDRQSSEWKDGETIFMRGSIWREQGENVSESLTKGARVIAQGRLKARSFETKEGERRTVWEMDYDEIGPSLKRATAQVTKTTGKSQTAPQSQPTQQPAADPWGAQGQAQGGWDTPADQGEIPF